MVMCEIVRNYLLGCGCKQSFCIEAILLLVKILCGVNNVWDVHAEELPIANRHPDSLCPCCAVCELT